ncbi:hypothetical protein ACFXPI_11105 [Streptomyces sp. NPDC059104]|uniref:hypothetical protein n=1 Tax=Streptomyces sp. NPDC059104 TaxID=3346729 RepID=UPI0036C53DD6
MTDYPPGPIGAALRAADARDQRPASGRHTADTITDDELDQLYAALRDARGEADRYFHNGLKSTGQADMRAYDAEQRAKQAEAALARVRAVAEELIKHGCPWSGDTPGAGRAVLAALNQQKEN